MMKSRFYERLEKDFKTIFIMGLQNYPGYAMEEFIEDKIKEYKKYGY